MHAIPACLPELQIIATDGLWEFVSDEEAVRIAAAARDPQEAVDALIREANRRWLQEEEVRGVAWLARRLYCLSWWWLSWLCVCVCVCVCVCDVILPVR